MHARGLMSVGAHDVVKTVLAPLGVWFGAVRIQPGRPQGFGRWRDGTPIFALPGNPVDVFVSFEEFVRPASGGGSGSYLVASLAGANALALVPESVTELRAGEIVDITPIS